jgi:hypothetical protein
MLRVSLHVILSRVFTHQNFAMLPEIASECVNRSQSIFTQRGKNAPQKRTCKQTLLVPEFQSNFEGAREFFFP